MYTILVTQDNRLKVSIKERVMQRSKLVDSFHFLVDPIYKDTIDMTDFTVTMEYILPVSKKYKTETLVLQPELYKEKLEYCLKFDTGLTAEAGEIELHLTFTMTELSPEGKATQYVRKTSPCTITIVPVAAWSDIIPDEALSALDQKILKMDEQIKALSESAVLLTQDKADNIVLDRDTNEIYLTSNGELLGDKISIDELGDVIIETEDDGLVQVII